MIQHPIKATGDYLFLLSAIFILLLSREISAMNTTTQDSGNSHIQTTSASSTVITIQPTPSPTSDIPNNPPITIERSDLNTEEGLDYVFCPNFQDFYLDHPTAVRAMTSIPLLWPVLIGFFCYQECYLPSEVITPVPQIQTVMESDRQLLSALSRNSFGMSKSLLASEVIVTWLGLHEGTHVNSLQLSKLSALSANGLLEAISGGIQQILHHPMSVSAPLSIDKGTTIRDILPQSFSDIIQTAPQSGDYSHVLTVVSYDNGAFILAFHQTASGFYAMALPSLFAIQPESSTEQRRYFFRFLTQEIANHQALQIYRLFY